jgi:hypothetical protein
MGTRLLRSICFLLLFSFFKVLGNAQQMAPQPLITQPVIESQVTTLTGNTHPLAQPQFDVGAAPPDLPMQRMLLVLKHSAQQDFALRKLLDDQQDKASPNYHKWLTPDEFGVQFGPSDQDIQVVTGWLQSHGFQVNRVSHGRTVIEFSGAEAQLEEALHTSIHKYLVHGEEHWANASDPQIPAALSPAVAGVWSLHDFRKKPRVHIFPQLLRTKYTPGMLPNTTFNTPQGVLHALGPADFAKIYNLGPVDSNPAGLPKISVVARSNFNFSDVQGFRSVFNLASPFYSQVILDGPDPGDLGGGEEAEVVLDTSWSGAVAPYAEVFVVVSASTNTTDGVDLSELYIIENQLGDVMTESFGSCEASVSQSEWMGQAALAQQAAAQGITYVVSAGDSGAEGCDDPNFETTARGPVSVNFLASSPYAVAVGGTMFNEGNQSSKYWNSTNSPGNFESALSYIPEKAWNESCTTASCGLNANILAGGGGASILFPKPSWQSGVAGIPADGARDLPDVSFNAAAGHDPYLLCLQGSCIPDAQGFIFFFGVGGTSVSAPAFAGIMALVDQATNSDQGQPNYVLYRLAASENLSQCNGSSGASPPVSNCVFNDITMGNIAVPGEIGYGSSSAQYQTGAGYDLATGLGSINGANLVSTWSSVTFNASSTTLSPGSISAVHGASVPVTVTVTGNNSQQTPTGSVALIENRGGFITGQAGITTLSLANGSVTANVSSLPGGSYSVFARYSGDATFSSSSSGLTQVNISPEPSTTSLSVLDANGNPFTGGSYGSFVYLRADVAGKSQNGAPTGSVMFSDTAGSIPGNPYPLNIQGNTATPNGDTTFAVGPHSIIASYGGDPSFNASSSSSAKFSVGQASTSVTFQANGAPQGALLTATINTISLGNPPSGSVTFYSGASAIGSASVITNNGSSGPLTTATLNDSQLANGQYTMTATYTGDTNYLGSSSPPTAINVQPDFSIQTSTNALAITTPGASASMTVTMTDLDGFTGQVAFSCSGLPAESKCIFNPASLSTTGSTTLTVTTKAPTVGMLNPRSHDTLWTLAFAMLGTSVGGIFLLPVLGGQRGRVKLLTLILLGVLCVGCGGGGGGGNNGPPPPDPGTPKGISVVTLTATSGTNSHTVLFGVGVF